MKKTSKLAPSLRTTILRNPTKQSSPSWRPNPTRLDELIQHPAATGVLFLLSVLIFALALFFIQEGEAHRAKPGVVFFVDFPAWLLIPSYLAAGLMIPNFAILLFTWWRRLYKRRWPYVFALIGVVCLGIVVWHIGFGGVLSIIDPSAK